MSLPHSLLANFLKCPLHELPLFRERNVRVWLRLGQQPERLPIVEPANDALTDVARTEHEDFLGQKRPPIRLLGQVAHAQQEDRGKRMCRPRP